MANTDKIRLYASGDVAKSAWADRLQERTLQCPFVAAGATPTNFDNGFATYAQALGADLEQQGPGSYDRMGCTLQGGGGIPAGNLVILDNSIDWRGRIVELSLFVTTDGATMPGGATANLFGTTALVTMATNALNPWYTNGGAINSGTTNNPTAGNPPNTGPGSIAALGGFRALTTVNVLTIYVEGKTPFRLGMYNAAGVALYVGISKLRASGKDGRF